MGLLDKLLRRDPPPVEEEWLEWDDPDRPGEEWVDPEPAPEPEPAPVPQPPVLTVVPSEPQLRDLSPAKTEAELAEPGTTWDGDVAYSHEHGVVPWPGHYAVIDNVIQPEMPVTWRADLTEQFDEETGDSLGMFETGGRWVHGR